MGSARRHSRSIMPNDVPANCQDAERIFHSLSQDGQITVPLAETFWAARFGVVTDRFGIPWVINCESPGPPPK